MLKDEITKALAPLKLERVAPGDYDKTGCHLEADAAAGQMVDVASALLSTGCFLASLTALDFPGEFHVVYHFANFRELCRTVVKAKVPKGQEAVSIARIYPGADWYEREVYDLFGLKFAGHPDLRRILLPFDADFHPLLKDFGTEKANA